MKKDQRAVYLLQHAYRGTGGIDETKILGIFSSRRRAMAAVKCFEKLPGFRLHKQGFYLDKYDLNAVFWREGFATAAKSRYEPST